MLVLDYIVFNSDRCVNNFGFIQNSITGEIQCPAPIFDTGSSLFFSDELKSSGTFSNQNFRSRTFAWKHDEQIKYADLSNLKNDWFCRGIVLWLL